MCLVCCPIPLRYTTVSRRPCVWYAGHGRGEVNKRSTDSKLERQVTIIPLTIGMLSGGRQSRFSEVDKFLSRDRAKKIETLESR